MAGVEQLPAELLPAEPGPQSADAIARATPTNHIPVFPMFFASFQKKSS
jgi:hypothetical protein